MCRHIKGKGLHVLIEALAQLREEGYQFYYLNVGSGPETPALKKQVQEARLTGNVHFWGEVAYGDALQFFCAADIYVQPSQPDGDFLESFGISFLEAQAAGLACIGSNWGGVPEAVSEGKTALLVPPGDVGALKRALVELINDHTRRKQMGEAGREWGAAHSWGAHAQSLSSALAAIAKKPALR
jgi:glycosyltransferase involved in cell wall biosynthesis